MGSAVKRNKLRRVIMAFFGNRRGFWNNFPEKNKDIVIIVAGGAASLPRMELKQELEKYGRIF